MAEERTKIYCVRCNQFTNHETVAEKSKIFTRDNTPGMQIDFAEGLWEILECCGCEGVTFRETWTTSEDAFDPDTGDCLTCEVHLYPPRSENMVVENHYLGIPETLERIYREVVSCYNGENYTLCAAGLRALIEGICVDRNIMNGLVRQPNGAERRRSNLEGKIQGMAEAGFLTQEHASILHELRFLGNAALHELQTPAPKQLRAAIEIVEHTLENLYELAGKAQVLHRTRVRRSKT